MRGEELKELLGEQLIVYAKLTGCTITAFYDSVLIEGDRNFLIRNPSGLFVAEHGENFIEQALIERDIEVFKEKLIELL